MKSLGSGSGIEWGRRVVPLNQFSLVGVGTDKRLCIYQSTVLVEQADLHFEGLEWAARFEKKVTEEEL